MSRARMILLACLVCGVSLPAGRAGQTSAAAPTLDAVLDRYAQALGGRPAFDKLTSVVMKGTVELPSTGETGNVEIYKKPPNKRMSLMNIPSWGPDVRGFDGTNGWLVDPDAGPMDLGADDLPDAKREADFFKDLRLKDLYPKMSLKGKEKVGGRDTYVVEAAREKGGVETFYFDAENGLLLRDDSPYVTSDGTSVLESTFEDYRDVGGIHAPFTIRQTSPDFDFVIRFREITPNAPVDDSKFQKPKAAN